MEKPKSLEQLLSSAGNVVEWLRNMPVDTWEFVGVPSQFTNWRDEQLAVHESAVILHQGHMRDPLGEFYVSGPDALKLLSHLGTNSFANFKVNQAKQYIVCNYDGYLIGDCILFYLAENEFALIGAMVIAEWIKFHARAGRYDVQLSHKHVVKGPDGKNVTRDYYQLQIQGPKAKAIIEKLNAGVFPDLKFFRMGALSIAGREVRCLRHSMSGTPGLEIWFPREYREEIVQAIVEAGREFGLKQIGTRAYPAQTLESAWMGLPLPAIYSGESMKPYREFLTAEHFEAQMSLSGSFVGKTVDEYYYTPYEHSYGQFVKFDHDFIGREALEKMAKQKHRKKVTLLWNPDDVAKIFSSLGNPKELPYKYFEMPWAPYGMVQCDRVSKDGRTVGRSQDVGYSHFVRSFLSLAIVEPEIALGDEVVVTWGEENAGTRKPSVERHRQLDIRAGVCPAPYTKVAREEYHAGGWRSGQP
jgi:vanillate/3-O-methylgallate O-demethylase